MDTLAYSADSRQIENRASKRSLHPHVRNYETTQAEVGSFHWPHRLARDANVSHLLNFPFAFTVFIIATTGLVAVGFGITITNGWLAGLGFLITLVGCFLYGWSLHDE